MKKIFNMSIPRSGHHLLERILRSYFGATRFHYCEMYLHCKQVPCVDPKTVYQKNHDFKLLTEKNEALRYVIQYRHPYAAISSEFTLYSLPKSESTIPCTQEEWNSFLVERIEYWNKFCEKWAIEAPKHAVLIDYDELVRSPFDQAIRVIQLFGEDPIDKNRLQNAIAKRNVENRNSLSSFEFFNQEELDWVELNTKEAMERLGIASLSC